MIARFPRIRGDVPHSLPNGFRIRGFSPHTRGCSYIDNPPFSKEKVFPAYAGMFPRGCLPGVLPLGFPRIRGDVPPWIISAWVIPRFSPHTRGCSHGVGGLPGGEAVFPAYAGMFQIRWGHSRVPRVVFPAYAGMFHALTPISFSAFAFSPHTRGCSCMRIVSALVTSVFPAYAGMFRLRRIYLLQIVCFPRIRGDVPTTEVTTDATPRFSPHTRGCSQIVDVNGTGESVFPAYAGMFPLVVVWSKTPRRFPRIRGDVPSKPHLIQQRIRFSPHTRGCSYTLAV